MPDFNDMTFFVAVAEALSFSRAAEKLQLPQSTLSRRISALEKALGLQLLQRTTRRIELTVAGRHFYERARTIVEEAKRLYDELDGNSQQPCGLLRLSLPVDFAYPWLAPRLPAFAARYPDIRLHLDVSPQRVDLFREPVDAVIRAGDPQDDRLIARPLLQLPRYLYAAPAYLAAHGEVRQPADLAHHRCLSFPADDQWTLRHHDGRSETVAIAAPYCANSLGLLQRLAVTGMGIVILPPHAADGLTRILPDWAADPVTIHLLTATRLLPARVKCFLDFVREAAEVP